METKRVSFSIFINAVCSTTETQFPSLFFMKFDMLFVMEKNKLGQV